MHRGDSTSPASRRPTARTQVPGAFYLNPNLQNLVYDELDQHVARGGTGGFLPAVKQIANVAALPGIVGVRLPLLPPYLALCHTLGAAGSG